MLVILLALCVVAPSAIGQPAQSDSPATTGNVETVAPEKPTSHWPDGVEFDPDIPTPESYFGFDPGERHLSHAQVAGYMRLLAESTERISIQQYGTTHGMRPLLLLTITSDGNRQRLDEIRAAHLELTGENGTDVAIDKLPVVINMGYGVHGDEPSATNSSPLVAYYLAAARGPEIETWLENCIVLLDPSLNPDGFNRFANWANRYRGMVPNPDPQHAEHNQQWPAGRVNYYWFDLNRDWLPLVHPESRARMTWYHSWKPNVVLDFHEMGTNSTYFFQPGIPERTNPLTPARNVELTAEIAQYHARALDEKGTMYFTRERFDDFYMGKGSTYPDLHGAVGILFEQASSRGHVQQTTNGLLTFHKTVNNQFTTSLSSLRAVSDLREKLIRYKQEFYRGSFEKAADKSETAYVFTCPNNPSRLNQFADVLTRHDIDCYRLKKSIQQDGLKLFRGTTLIVPLQQSEYRFLQSLLMTRTRFKENIFYDVSAWTLPMAFGVIQSSMKGEFHAGRFEPYQLESPSRPRKFSPQEQDVAYLIDWRDDAAPHLLNRMLDSGIRVRGAMQPLKMKTGSGDDQKTRRFGRGTLSVVPGTQPELQETIHQLLAEGAENGLRITAVQTGLVDGGIDLGSPDFPVLEKPKIAMVTGRGVSAYGAGEVWHLLDHQMRMPVTLLKSENVTRIDANRYNTLVIATGGYTSEVRDAAKEFARQGGTVIVVGNTAVTVQKQLAAKEGESANESGAAEKPETAGEEEEKEIQKPFASARDEAALKLISGAIFQTQIDVTHPLMFGMPDQPLAVFRNHSTLLQPSDSPYRNPAVYTADPLLAGYCSDENVEHLKGTASVVVVPEGRGRFILMADNPNFRGFWRSTSRVFLNAVFFGSRAN